MDALFLKKFRNTFILIGIICFLCAGLIILIVMSLVTAANQAEKIQVLEQRLASYRDIFGAQPDKTIKDNKSLAKELKKEEAEFKNIFLKDKSKMPTQATPLSFKRELFNIEDGLRKKAQESGVNLPQSLGFEEYKRKVPEPEQTLHLIKELYMMEEVVNLLLEAKVAGIMNVEFPQQSKQKITTGASNNNLIFQEVMMNISLESDFDSVKKILIKLLKIDNVYIIENLDIKHKDAKTERLLVDMKLKFVQT